MFCPACRAEYEEGLMQCPECDLALVDELPIMEHPEKVELVTIFESGNEVLIALAKSLLEEAKIPFVVKGEGLQDLIGAGRFGSGFNPIVGPVEIQVEKHDEEEARNLLAEL